MYSVRVVSLSSSLVLLYDIINHFDDGPAHTPSPVLVVWQLCLHLDYTRNILTNTPRLVESSAFKHMLYFGDKGLLRDLRRAANNYYLSTQ